MMTRVRHSASCAMLIAAALAAPPALAAQDSERRAVSDRTTSLILAPLRDELTTIGAPSPSAISGAQAQSGLSLRYHGAASAHLAPALDVQIPVASTLASAALTARAPDPAARYGLSAFSGRSAVLARTPTGSQVSVSMSDSAFPGAAQLAFDPEFAEAASYALSPVFIDRHRNMAVNYEAFFDAPGGQGGLDLGVSPRAGVSVGDDGPAARAGATVRLGQYLGELENDRPAWWFFAGADRQAVLYDPGQGFDVRGAFAMQPYAMVGDAQAGVAVRVGAADVSLAYVHRETRYALPQQDWETSEGFAAFSLTWKR